jgi:hypothetical protein
LSLFFFVSTKLFLPKEPFWYNAVVANRELILSPSPNLDLVYQEWNIDLSEVRERVFHLLDILGSPDGREVLDIQRRRNYALSIPWNAKMIIHAFEKKMKKEMGMGSQQKLQLTLGQVCLLCWTPVPGSWAGDELFPAHIQLARVVEANINKYKDMIVDVVDICQIPHDDPEIRRVYFDPQKSTVIRREVYGDSPIVVPLKGRK